MASGGDSGMKHACGVFGCVAAGEWPTALDVPQIICLGLVGLQHRGQESAGIVTGTGTPLTPFKQKKGTGYVSSVFGEEDLAKLKGNLGIGHTRYSTIGGSDVVNIQPFVVETLHGLISVAHNGELVNSSYLKNKLLRHGVGLSTGSDSELITQLLTHMPDCGEPDGPNWVGRIKKMMKQTPTSYSLIIMQGDKIYAIRDPYGNRPLSIGKLLSGQNFPGHVENTIEEERCEGWVVSSESCSFNGIGARYYREVLPGEIVELSKKGLKSHYIVKRPEAKLPAFCIFEYVYFARPDSVFEGQMVYQVRQRCGRQLALEAPADADLVSTVPESATPAAIAYAETLGIPYGEVLCKNRYVGRTFIQPSTRLRKLGMAKKFGLLTQNCPEQNKNYKQCIPRSECSCRSSQIWLGIPYGEVLCKNRYVGRTFIQPSTRLRKLGVAKKFGLLTQNFLNKKIVLVDDSIVRGNTMTPIIQLLKQAGAKEVHVRVASPPIKHPCYMGINIPTKEELIANKVSMDKIANHFGADSLTYLSVDGLVKATQSGITDNSVKEVGHCVACLTGEYPIKLDW